MLNTKKKQIVIVEVREAFRKGLCAIFAEEPSVEVFEASTSEEFVYLLKKHSFDLIVIHQSLITDITLFSRTNVAILATEPDFRILSLARSYGAQAYLQENVSGSLLRQLLYLPSGIFLNDMAVSSWVSEYLACHTLFAIDNEVLTPREREVFHLLFRGLSNHAIAQQLGLSESTLKTHLKHIYEKLHLKRRQIRLFSDLGEGE